MTQIKSALMVAMLAAGVAGQAHANFTSTTVGLTTTYTENFNGGTSFSGGVLVDDGADDYLSLQSSGSGSGAASYSFTFATAIAAVGLSFWHTGSTNSDPVGFLSLERTDTTPDVAVFTPVSFNAVTGVNPGGATGAQYISPVFTNLSAGTYTLRFARGGGQDVFRIDDVAVVVTSVPEPGTLALMLAGFGVVGAIAQRQRRPAQAAL